MINEKSGDSSTKLKVKERRNRITKLFYAVNFHSTFINILKNSLTERKMDVFGVVDYFSEKC